MEEPAEQPHEGKKSFFKRLRDKFGKDLYWILGGATFVLLLYGFLAYQLFAGMPFFLSFENDEVAFKYPKWTSGNGYVVKTENPIRGAGVEVMQKNTNNLPLSASVEMIKINLTKDRQINKEEINPDQAYFELEFGSSKGQMLIFAKAVTAGSSTYVFSGYTLKDKLGKNEKVIRRFLDSVTVKKQPLLAVPDVSGMILKNVKGERLIGYSSKGEELVLKISNSTQVTNKSGVLAAKDIPANVEFFAKGKFEEKSKTLFTVDILVVGE